MFFFAAPAGLLVDRFEPRRILMLAVSAQAALAVALAFTPGTAAILALTALLGTGAAVAQPAEFALIPSVAAGNLGRANSAIETARALGFALGPFAGGALAAAGGMKLGLLADAGTSSSLRSSRSFCRVTCASPPARASPSTGHGTAPPPSRATRCCGSCSASASSRCCS
jgi:MFS family permease